MTYAEQLKHPLWQQKRLEIMQNRLFTCEVCESKDTTLNIHHKIYRKGRKPWEYADEEYACLCEVCHKQAHAIQDESRELFALLDHIGTQQVVGYMKAMLATFGPSDRKPANYPEAFGASDYFRISPFVLVNAKEDGTDDMDNMYQTARFIHGMRFEYRRG